MLDELLRIGCAFDWMTPTSAFVQDFVNGPPADFGIPEAAGWSRGEIRRLLRRHGVRVWGLMYVGDKIIFSVPESQARWAHYLLKHQGIPILSAPDEAAHQARRQSHGATNPDTMVDQFFAFLDRLDRSLG